MKRAKIMLLAIAVIATVGGALAFKAQRFSHQNVYCATTAGGNLTCITTDVPFKITNQSPSFSTPCSTWHAALGITTTSYYTTTGPVGGAACDVAPKLARVTGTS